MAADPRPTGLVIPSSPNMTGQTEAMMVTRDQDVADDPQEETIVEILNRERTRGTSSNLHHRQPLTDFLAQPLKPLLNLPLLQPRDSSGLLPPSFLHPRLFPPTIATIPLPTKEFLSGLRVAAKRS